MKVRVVKSRHDTKDYTVELKQGVQYFRLDYGASRRDAQWYARMFRKALKQHDTERLIKAIRRANIG
jgi:hypothetical protein